ncbi:hypothetical protein SteCoe_31897 [Stentor coeruleus]|uniref:Uncharacterized protein n=1 Tax=Stentor coeruleus TaxID=5963 RepID=A0A1R2B0A6_9CILI|nr:hypothetical protein SteCoe_31897 [Stentor coeruleus]
MGKQEILYYSNSTIYSYCVWALIICYTLDCLFACIQLLKPLYSLYKKRVVLILFLVSLSCIIRIVTLVTVEEVQLYQLYLLLCTHCICYQCILWTLSSIIFDLSVTLNHQLDHFVKLKLKKIGKFIAFATIILYTIFMIIFSISTDLEDLFIVDIVFWFVSFCIFSSITYYLYFKIKPIYVYGLSYNARKAIKFLFFVLLSFVIIGLGVNNVLQALFPSINNTNIMSLMTFFELFLCDIIPFSIFLIAFALNREEESQSFLLLDEKELIESEKKSLVIAS